mmetsp:Transcript_39038/g.107541  ORF Transcript_39038/g.107541 Transcript_39038/m.107541 type:complete len:115 (+) Transcript_39038:1347-1691(+)
MLVNDSIARTKMSAGPKITPEWYMPRGSARAPAPNMAEVIFKTLLLTEPGRRNPCRDAHSGACALALKIIEGVFLSGLKASVSGKRGDHLGLAAALGNEDEDFCQRKMGSRFGT